MHHYQTKSRSKLRSSSVIRTGLIAFALTLLPTISFGQQKLGEETKVIVTISVDWEGATLTEENLTAFSKFRDDYPDIPLTQFLNAAYYLRDDSKESVTDRIRSVLREQDELGLHIHSWRFLVEKSGVEFRKGPRFWSPDTPVRKLQGDEGHDVELAAYNPEEIEKIARTSIKILSDNGFQISNSFRAGGWIASDDVLNGIRRAGFLVDTSATDRTWHVEELEKYPIFDRIGELWSDVNQHTPTVLHQHSFRRHSGNARHRRAGRLCLCSRNGRASSVRSGKGR